MLKFVFFLDFAISSLNISKITQTYTVNTLSKIILYIEVSFMFLFKIV